MASLSGTLAQTTVEACRTKCRLRPLSNLMDVLLNIIGFLGLGALIIAAWVFASSAKRYLSGEDLQETMAAMESDLSPYRHWQQRSGTDRRRHDRGNVFPMVINGIEIKEDRRVRHDRRHVA